MLKMRARLVKKLKSQGRTSPRDSIKPKPDVRVTSVFVSRVPSVAEEGSTTRYSAVAYESSPRVNRHENGKKGHNYSTELYLRAVGHLFLEFFSFRRHDPRLEATIDALVSNPFTSGPSEVVSRYAFRPANGPNIDHRAILPRQRHIYH